jgi:hypothetical protein
MNSLERFTILGRRLISYNLKMSFLSLLFPKTADFASKPYKVQYLKYLVVLTILAIKF